MPEFHMIDSAGDCWIVPLHSVEADGRIFVLDGEGQASGGAGLRRCDIHENWTDRPADLDDFRGTEDGVSF